MDSIMEETNMHKFHLIAIFILALVVQQVQAADIITLKNGTIISGRIIEESRESVRIRTNEGISTFAWNEIKDISTGDNSKVESVSSQPPSIKKPTYSTPVVGTQKKYRLPVPNHKQSQSPEELEWRREVRKYENRAAGYAVVGNIFVGTAVIGLLVWETTGEDAAGVALGGGLLGGVVFNWGLSKSATDKKNQLLRQGRAKGWTYHERIRVTGY